MQNARSLCRSRMDTQGSREANGHGATGQLPSIAVSGDGAEFTSRRDLYEHLKILWQTFGLISALIVSACITSLNSDVSKLDSRKRQVFGCIWTACLMANIAALAFSIVGLGLVLRLRSQTDVEKSFGWDYKKCAVYLRTMLPSVFTVFGAILFTAACIVTACFKFGRAACITGESTGALIIVIGSVTFFYMVIIDQRPSSTHASQANTVGAASDGQANRDDQSGNRHESSEQPPPVKNCFCSGHGFLQLCSDPS